MLPQERGRTVNSNLRSDPLTDPQLGAAADRLKAKFEDAQGFVSVDEVEDAVRDAAVTLRSAPVQTFAPVIAENTARNRLQELKRRRQAAA